jgi:hypothetical protein
LLQIYTGRLACIGWGGRGDLHGDFYVNALSSS